MSPSRHDDAVRRPSALAPGARVGLVAPAGPIADDRFEAALERCRFFDLEPVPGRSARLRTGYLAGSDEERRRDLQEMLDDPAIDAVWALRGGYGTMRLLPDLSAPLSPKPYIGFSDNTALHLWLLGFGCVSFHGPHAGGEFTPLAIDCFRRVLFDPEPAGSLPLAAIPQTWRGGQAEGRLLGGNLSLLAALCGTPWQPDARGCILFIEEVGEPPYRVDRMLRQLELAGVTRGVTGLLIGQFTECETAEDDELERAALREFAERLAVPTLAGLPFGHVAENWTLPVGVRAGLDADAGTLSLLEPAVEAR